MVIEFLFLGLLAFVPDADGFHVLLVDATSPWMASDACPVPSHEAFLAVDADAVADPAVCAHELTKYPVPCTWRLDHDDVVVEGTLKGIPLSANDPSAAPMVKIEEFYPPAGFVKGHCLDPKPDRELLIGRFTVAGDNLSLETESACQAKVDFHPILRQVPDKNLDRVIADLAGLGATADSGVTLRVKRFNSLGTGRVIRLQARPGGVPTRVLIALVGPDPGPPKHTRCDSETFDRHFEAFFRLAAYEPYLYERLVPFAQCKMTTPPLFFAIQSFLLQNVVEPEGFNERIICPMAQFKPTS